MAHGRVLHSASVDEMALKFPRKQKESTESVETDTALAKEAQSSIISGISGGEDSGAVVFLFPPKEQLSWSLSRLWLMWKLFWLDILKPAYDTGCKELVSIAGSVHSILLCTSMLISLSTQRVDQLFAANKKGFKSAQAQYLEKRMWYLEVVAVHPSLQSRGIGGGVMMCILEHVGDQPVYLECTRRDNVGFYEKFGFQVVDEVELLDEEQNLKFWAMVRPGK